MSALLRRFFFALVAFALTGTFGSSPVLAGTTGSIVGAVTDGKSLKPLAGVRVEALSPSQSTATTTGANGRFTFISLAPDTYAITLSKSGYERLVAGGITVQADQELSEQLTLQPSLQQIGHVTARSPLDLVKPGTTADVYSVGPAVAGAASPLGGGGALNSAYSAIASLPGVFVPPGQQGVNQSVFIRGGYYDQIGYEYDGVPMNRSFDNYPGHSATTLGQQELQVYTGGAGAGASATGLAGFINQVVRTGTYPPSGTLSGRFGSPTFDHDLQFEIGGATPSRSFNYYVGALGSDQGFRYFDNANGAGLTALFPNAIGPSNQTTNLHYYPAVYPNCNPADLSEPTLTFAGGATQWNDPGCFSSMNPVYGNIAQIRDREAVANFHFALPHGSDGARDDVQLLYTNSAQYRQYYSGLGDVSPGIRTYLGTVGWPDRLTYPAGTPFLAPANVAPIAYPFPGSPDTRCFNTSIAVPGQCGANAALLPSDYRDARWDTQSMVKLQYQKNIGTNAYVRLFGYSEYFNTNRSGASRRALGSGFGVSNYDYEVDTHKHGVELQFGDQINAQHQLSGWVQYEAESLIRDNNFNYLNSSSTQTSNLTNGTQCFAYHAGTGDNGIDTYTAGAPAPCNDSITQGTFRRPTQNLAVACGAPGTAIPAAACAAGASWALTYTGNQAGLNTVKPRSLSAALSDEWKPTDRLDVTLGLRMVRDQYLLSNTNTPGKNFWFGAAQREYCYNPVTLQPVFVPQPPQSQSKEIPYVTFACPIDSSSGTAVQTVHPDGQNGHLLLGNVYDPTLTQSYFLPRVGLTYTPNHDTVWRFSAGRYAQQPQAYEVQYNSQEENLANQLIGFFPYGFTTPRHDSLPQYSNNFDFSYERHFPGTDASVKVTPYYRWATNQLYTVSVYGQSPALNSGIERSQGIELQLTKGDFRRNGFAATFSYTYLDSKEKWANFAGTNRNVVDGFNDIIKQYNALTQAGGGAACYSSKANTTPDPACGSTSVLNPYYASSPQPLFDRNGWFETGLDFPYLSPNVFALVTNYRHDRFAISPALTLNQGTTYGSPADLVGIDPRTCRSNLAGGGFTTGNPLAADYTSCRVAATPSGNVYTPNPETGHFDRFGEFRQPWQLNLGMQVSYDLSAKVTLNMTVTNLFNRCFGGSSTAWTRAYPAGSVVCGYQSNTFYVNNFYNGSSPNDVAANGVPLNPYFAHSFVPSYADTTSFGYANPLNVYLQLRIKL